MVFNLFEVVKFEGSSDAFAWRYHNANVKKNTTVVVGPNQIAFWVSNGVIVKAMGPGKHRIDGNYTQGLSWVVSRFHSGEVPSSGEIWFVSTGLRNLNWGTPNRISINLNYFDAFKTTARIAANGNVQVKLAPQLDAEGEDGTELLWQFIQELREQYGDERSVTQRGMQRFLVDSVLTRIQGGLAQVLRQVNYGDHYAQLPQLSEYLAVHIAPELDRYGMELRSFQIRALEGDERSVEQFASWWGRLTEADIEKYEKLRAAEAERFGIEQTGFGTAASRQAQGFTFQEERQFDVLQSGAGNTGVGGDFMSAGVGLAMGSQMGNVMGGMFVQSAEDVQASREQQPDVPPPPTTGLFVANDLGATATAPGRTSEPEEPARPDRGADDEEPAAAPKFCMHCGEQIVAAARFCPMCGGAQ
ncbi:SPFH domain-containing protein [Gulosibacter sp. 10]|uniref:SPFH domain-containing protein n=1 Tax=Gulosibacter sp. 10 TaxID=1255570 RepID=UPI00097EAC6E|nr:SPFH domain-containing protein [Gulosibacter sp. 10]SJM67223.1 hypothetical protein FM112_12355 [Gulosibacter sp. 10]